MSLEATSIKRFATEDWVALEHAVTDHCKTTHKHSQCEQNTSAVEAQNKAGNG